jgi:hypothetical protein
MDDINKKSFSRMIETFVRTHRGVGYLEAILELCERNAIDPRDTKKLINKEVVEKLEFEVREINLLEGGNQTYQLPVDFR